MFETIKLLTELSGPCGQEDAVQAVVEARWRELGVRVETVHERDLDLMVDLLEAFVRNG